MNYVASEGEGVQVLSHAIPGRICQGGAPTARKETNQVFIDRSTRKYARLGKMH